MKRCTFIPALLMATGLLAGCGATTRAPLSIDELRRHAQARPTDAHAQARLGIGEYVANHGDPTQAREILATSLQTDSAQPGARLILALISISGGVTFVRTLSFARNWPLRVSGHHRENGVCQRLLNKVRVLAKTRRLNGRKPPGIGRHVTLHRLNGQKGATRRLNGRKGRRLNGQEGPGIGRHVPSDGFNGRDGTTRRLNSRSDLPVQLT